MLLETKAPRCEAIDAAGRLVRHEDPYRVGVVTALDDIRALRDEWDDLLADSASAGLFLTWEWLHACCRHLSGSVPSLLTIRRRGELVALAPLAVDPSPWWGPSRPRRVQFLGTGAVGSDYLDVIARRGMERPVAEVLADHLERQGSAVWLAQLRGSGSTAAELGRGLVGRGYTAIESLANVCPFVDLRGLSWNDYVAGLGPSHRANLRRRTRKLAERFHVAFERVTEEGDLAPAMDVFFSLHERRWRDRGSSDALATPAVVAFHREVAHRALSRGWLRLYLLRLDDRPVAAFYGFRYGGSFLYYQSGFDPEYGRHAVALVAMSMAIRAAIEEGASEFDMLHGTEPYKLLWTKRAHRLVRLELYPPSLHGMLERHCRGAARGAKRTLRRFLPGSTEALPADRWSLPRNEAGLS